MRRLIRLLVAAWPLALLCACGVSTQRSPEAISVPSRDLGAPSAPTTGPVLDTVFFVRGTRLVAAQRRTSTAGDLREVLELLSNGPSAGEAHDGLRTALAPQPITVREARAGTLTLGVTRQFTGVVGGNQLLAVAQVVWTVTQFGDVDRVRFVTDGEALEVPTDRGLSTSPVDRSDYRSVAPPFAPPTGTPSSSSATTAPAPSALPSSAPPT